MNETELSMYREAVKAGNFMAMRQVSWSVAESGKSQKAARLLEICDEAKAGGRKVIVFSFFRNTVNRVMQLMGERCIGPITGDISLAKRQEIFDEFADESVVATEAAGLTESAVSAQIIEEEKKRLGIIG